MLLLHWRCAGVFLGSEVHVHRGWICLLGVGSDVWHRRSSRPNTRQYTAHFLRVRGPDYHADCRLVPCTLTWLITACACPKRTVNTCVLWAKIIFELDIMCWFSQRRSGPMRTMRPMRCFVETRRSVYFFCHDSAKRHIFGGVRPGLWPPNSNSAEIFVHCTYPQVSSSYVYSFGIGSHRVDKQTNRRRWKPGTVLRGPGGRGFSCKKSGPLWSPNGPK